MRRAFLPVALAALCLVAACKEEAAVPNPVALDAEAIGYFCQMNILDHGGPKAQVHLDAFPGKPLFFSQVRDAVAYLRMQEKDGQILATYVTDMGSSPDWNAPALAAWIPAEKAVYVVGSDRLGGMDQPEFVPFAEAAAAEAFAAEHGGNLMTLAEIPDSALSNPEAEAAPSDATDFTTRLKSLSQPEGN